MGYTHYWERTAKKRFTVAQWKDIREFANKIIAEIQKRGIKLVYEWDESDKPPEVTADHIRFNGAGDDGHETFLMLRAKGSGQSGEWFCKTARKDYDIAVVWCLEACRLVTHGDFEWSSDGDGEPELVDQIRDFYKTFQIPEPPWFARRVAAMGAGEE